MGLVWRVASPGSLPPGAATAAEQGALVERIELARSYDAATSDVPDGWNTSGYHAESEALAAAVAVREAWQSARSAALGGALAAGMATGLAFFVLLGRRRVRVALGDAAVHIDGRRIPSADLRRVSWSGRRLVVQWEGGSTELASTPSGTIAELFRLEEALRARLPSPEAQVEEQVARDRIRASHAQFVQQFEAR